MKTKNILAIGFVFVSAGVAYYLLKAKKNPTIASSTVGPQLPNLSNSASTTIATPTLATNPINPLPLSELDAQIANLPSNTTIAQLQPLIAQQQIANAQAEIEKQHQAEFLAMLINNKRAFGNKFFITEGMYDGKAAPYAYKSLSELQLMMNNLGYKEEGAKAIKL